MKEVKEAKLVKQVFRKNGLYLGAVLISLAVASFTYTLLDYTIQRYTISLILVFTGVICLVFSINERLKELQRDFKDEHISEQREKHERELEKLNNAVQGVKNVNTDAIEEIRSEAKRLIDADESRKKEFKEIIEELNEIGQGMWDISDRFEAFENKLQKRLLTDRQMALLAEILALYQRDKFEELGQRLGELNRISDFQEGGQSGRERA